MAPIRSTTTRLLIHLLLWATAFSRPFDRQTVLGDVRPLEVPCDSIDLYTLDWFLGHTRHRFRQEIHGKALFYTKGGSKHAQELACNKPTNYVTIWQIWEPWLYNSTNALDNRLRCIHRDHGLKQRFYENMSEAFARMARKSARVMHLSSDYDDQEGIWGRKELPALRDLTDVDQIDRINPDGTLRQRWSLLDKGPKSIANKAIEEVRRIFRLTRDPARQPNDDSDVDVDSCVLWDGKEGDFFDSLL